MKGTKMVPIDGIKKAAYPGSPQKNLSIKRTIERSHSPSPKRHRRHCRYWQRHTMQGFNLL